MLGNGQIENFYFLSGMHIPKFCSIIAKIKKKYPIYEKYAMEEIKALDEELFLEIMWIYRGKEACEVQSKWISLCKYVLNELGNIDIKSYQVVSKLEEL